MASPLRVDAGGAVTPEDREALEKAYAAAESMQTLPLPGLASQAVGHPGLLSYAVDSPAEYANDQRRAELLRRLSEYSKDINPLSAFGPDLGGDIQAYRRGKIDNTPYHHRGFFTPGAPLHTGMQWWASVPALFYNTGKVLGNQITPGMYPEAERNLAKAANTLTMYAAEDYGLAPKGTGTIAEDADEANYARGRVGFSQPASVLEAYGALQQEKAQDKIDQAIPSGWQHYESLGLPPEAAVPLGVMSDIVLDPYSSAGSAMRLARAGKAGAAAGEVLKDSAMGAGIPAATSVPYYLDKLINRLHGVKDGHTAFRY